jgi:Flp pilus assembly protein TadB
MTRLKSEEVVISAPMSFNGSALRIWKLTRASNPMVQWFLLMPLALVLICIAWVFVFLWYMIFGLLLVSYRLIRRSGRKQKRDKLRHRELLEAIERSKQGNSQS